MNSYHVQMTLFLTPVQPHPPSAPLYATVALVIRLPPLDLVVFLINSHSVASTLHSGTLVGSNNMLHDDQENTLAESIIDSMHR